MSRRERRRSRFDRDAVEEHDRIGLGLGASSDAPPKPPVSSDDEANEDLSLKIVEKSLLMRAARLVSDDGGGGVAPAERAGIDGSARGEKEVDGSRAEKVVMKVIKKKKVKKSEIKDQNVFDMKEEDKPKVVGVVSEATEPNPVENSDNSVLRKLLRGPRYFDPPDSSWGVCYNCGEEGHAAVNCTAARRKKPCFVCGSFEHNVKQCTKGQDCFICKKTGHRAKDCPDKFNSSSSKSKICLKCGDSGHDMFSCWNDYDLEDLKEICCYVCKKLGHLCCANFVNSCPKEVSCYRCGLLGHTGLSCSRSNMETTGMDSSCFKCGEEGHFARECTNSSKSHKRIREPSTPTLKPHKEHKHDKKHKSAPHDLGKGARKKKKIQHEGSNDTTPRKPKYEGNNHTTHRKPKHEGNNHTTPRKPKHRGGWITEDPEDYSFNRNNYSGWRSPASPNGHRTPYMPRGGYVSTPQSYKNTSYAYGTPHFHGESNGYYQYQNGHSGSRFGYPSGGSNGGSRNNRSYGW